MSVEKLYQLGQSGQLQVGDLLFTGNKKNIISRFISDMIPFSTYRTTLQVGSHALIISEIAMQPKTQMLTIYISEQVLSITKKYNPQSNNFDLTFKKGAQLNVGYIRILIDNGQYKIESNLSFTCIYYIPLSTYIKEEVLSHNNLDSKEIIDKSIKQYMAQSAYKKRYSIFKLAKAFKIVRLISFPFLYIFSKKQRSWYRDFSKLYRNYKREYKALKRLCTLYNVKSNYNTVPTIKPLIDKKTKIANNLIEILCGNNTKGLLDLYYFKSNDVCFDFVNEIYAQSLWKETIKHELLKLDISEQSIYNNNIFTILTKIYSKKYDLEYLHPATMAKLFNTHTFANMIIINKILDK
jgi:hypothetical protein